MTEQHSNQNGRYGGPGLPMFYGVIASVGFMMGALAILMAGVTSGGHLSGRMGSPVGVVHVANGLPVPSGETGGRPGAGASTGLAAR
ncbi:hypothetical protein [Methylobacterium sp. J-076]|uniref:hypothetical protein n=1 Tax=Methylobacterium sp. J-076 TaxID=2836655 RepID=UPI001FBAC386|nr:hypothetical protein [Methylobacterium sp. J-076]MCJ2014761.1 hypothetical protein [Methylobacterium sp. J-076]